MVVYTILIQMLRDHFYKMHDLYQLCVLSLMGRFRPFPSFFLYISNNIITHLAHVSISFSLQISHFVQFLKIQMITVLEQKG